MGSKQLSRGPSLLRRLLLHNDRLDVFDRHRHAIGRSRRRGVLHHVGEGGRGDGGAVSGRGGRVGDRLVNRLRHERVEWEHVRRVLGVGYAVGELGGPVRAKRRGGRAAGGGQRHVAEEGLGLSQRVDVRRGSRSDHAVVHAGGERRLRREHVIVGGTFVVVVVSVVTADVLERAESLLLDIADFFHLVGPGGGGVTRSEATGLPPFVDLTKQNLSLSGQVAEKLGSEETLVALVVEVRDGAVDDGRLGWTAVGRERGQQTGEIDELCVQSLTTLTLDGVVLVTLLGGVDALTRLLLGLIGGSRRDSSRRCRDRQGHSGESAVGGRLWRNGKGGKTGHLDRICLMSG